MKGEGMGVWENVQNIGQKLGRPFIKSDSKTRSERGDSPIETPTLSFVATLHLFYVFLIPSL